MKSPDGGCVIEYVEVVGDTLDLSVTCEDKFGRPFDLSSYTATVDIFLPDTSPTDPLLTLPVSVGNTQRNLEVIIPPTETTALGKGVFRSQLKLIDSLGNINSLVLGKITLVDPNSSSLRLPNKPSGGNRVVIENNKLSVRLEATQGLRGEKGDQGIYDPPQTDVVLFNDMSPITLKEVPAGTILTFATVSVLEGFDGEGAYITVGTDLEPEKYISMSEIDILAATINIVQINKIVSSTETIKLFINAGTLATEGKVFVRIEAK